MKICLFVLHGNRGFILLLEAETLEEITLTIGAITPALSGLTSAEKYPSVTSEQIGFPVNLTLISASYHHQSHFSNILFH